MSVYAKFSDSVPTEVASNQGWSQFGDWVDSLGVTEFSEVIHLWEHGWSQNTEDLTNQLNTAIQDSPPINDVVTIVRGLCSFLRGEDTVIITAGVEDDPGSPTTNAFCPTGVGGGIDATCSPGGAASPQEGGGKSVTAQSFKYVVDHARAVGKSIGHAEHVVKTVIGDRIAEKVAKLPVGMQRKVIRSFAVSRFGTKLAFATWRAGQAFAERVAIERGRTPDEAKSLRGVLSGMDMATFKPISIGLHYTGIHASTLGALSMIPPASAGYLAYSTATHPVATLKAATRLVGDATSGLLKIGQKLHDSKFNVAGDEQYHTEVLDVVFKAHGYDDWYIALFSAALDETKDGFRAIKLANELYDAYPLPDENDPTTNADADGGGHWITTEDDQHIYISGQGEFLPKGPGSGKAPVGKSSPAPKPKLDLANHQHLAAAITHAGRDLPAAIGPAKNGHNKEGWESHKVYISQLYDSLKPQLGDTTLDQFKSKVSEMNRKGELRLSRIDLVQAANNPHELARSEVQFGRDTSYTHHVVDVNSAESRKHLAHNTRRITVNSRWADMNDPEKLEAFQEWLEQQFMGYLANATEEELWKKFINEGFKKGAGRAFDDTNKAWRWKPGQGKFYDGSKDQFLRSSFAQPEAVDKVKLLASRAFDELENVTTDMSNKMSRVLAQGLVQGQNPHDIAKTLAEEVDLGRGRATVVARTELIRAHAEGQLVAFKNLGVEELGVAVEWSTAGDDRVCEDCEPMEGVVLKLSEASGMIPRHPNCRCTWIPANVGEDSEDQQRSKGDIDSAIKTSLGKDDDEEWGPGASISRSRPQSIL